MADDDKTEDQAQREHNASRLKDQEMSVFSMFMMAAMAGGANASGAGKQADAAMNELKRRFT